MEHSGLVGRVLDWGSKVCSFETHCWNHCVVSLMKALNLLLSTVWFKPKKTGNRPVMTENC